MRLEYPTEGEMQRMAEATRILNHLNKHTTVEGPFVVIDGHAPLEGELHSPTEQLKITQRLVNNKVRAAQTAYFQPHIA